MSSLTIADGAINNLIKVLDHKIMDIEALKKLPAFIAVRNSMDSSLICNLKLTKHGVVKHHPQMKDE